MSPLTVVHKTLVNRGYVWNLSSLLLLAGWEWAGRERKKI